MDLAQAIKDLSSPIDPAPFRQYAGLPGLSSAYFALVQSEMTRNPRAAAKLASRWRSLLAHGDEPAFAYRTKGIGDRLAGRWKASATAFLRAGELAVRPVDQLVFQTGAIDSLGRAGRTDDAVVLGNRLISGLNALGEPGLAARAQLNTGNALQDAERNAEAIPYFEAAIGALDQAGFHLEALFARLGRSTAELYGGRIEIAYQLAAEARDLARQASEDYLATMCEFGMAHALMLQGRADEALALLLEMGPRVEDDPYDRARVHEFLGDAYVALNLWPEAIDAYRSALEERSFLEPMRLGFIELGLGRAQVLGLRDDHARKHFGSAARIFKRIGSRAWESASSTHLAELRQDHPTARMIAQRAVRAARDSKSTYHLAHALMISDHCHRRAGSGLARSERMIAEYGLASLAWKPAAIRAQLSPPSRRLATYRTAVNRILEDRMRLRSSTSRTAFHRDKGDIIAEFLFLLLQRPTRPRIREAIEVVNRSRSIALIDELLSPAEGEANSERESALQRLRVELATLEQELGGPAGTRRQSPSPAQISGVQRRWIEATHQLLETSETVGPASNCLVLVTARDRIYSLGNDRAIEIPLGLAELEEGLKWLKFELFAPMVSRDCGPEGVNTWLSKMQDAFAPAMRGTPAICPDGPLWQVPWTLMASEESILCLHPSMGGAIPSLPPQPTVVIWSNRAPDLYHAAEEEALYLQMFPNATVYRSAEEVRANLDRQVDLLHVIGHAHHNPHNPMFSAIQFEDGPLYATEIATSRLRADIVTLSACETGNLAVGLREEPDGLARAFLARGARGVLGSLWPLDDEAALRAFAAMIEPLAHGMNLRDSLQLSRQTVREWRQHPYFWGPLVMFGGYSK